MKAHNYIDIFTSLSPTDTKLYMNGVMEGANADRL